MAQELGLEKVGNDCWARHPLAFLVEAADDICYNIIDLEDGSTLGLVTFEDTLSLLKPILGKKFDPDGSYVKRYVPELASLPASVIHQPEVVAASGLAAASIELGSTYPEPIVDHAQARKDALAALATLKQ